MGSDSSRRERGAAVAVSPSAGGVGTSALRHGSHCLPNAPSARVVVSAFVTVISTTPRSPIPAWSDAGEATRTCIITWAVGCLRDLVTTLLGGAFLILRSVRRRRRES